VLIVEDWGATYPSTINHRWKFTEDFSEDDGKNVLFCGWGTVYGTNAYKEKYAHYENRMFFNTEQPCAFQGTDLEAALSANLDSYFTRIFTQDPYSAEWLNKIQQRDEKDIVTERIAKEYDTLYWGGIHGTHHQHILDVIKDYNYNFLSLGQEFWTIRDPHYGNLITYRDLPRPEMWELVRKTKINVMSNMLFIHPDTPARIRRILGWEQNRAFSHLDELIMPQIKTRPFESAMNRCLMLVWRDPWNVQEYFFTPDEHFLYYKDASDLKDKIDDILINWHNYEDMVERAFEKAISSYTTRHFIEEIQQECI
jgi:hypothetical protein